MEYRVHKHPFQDYPYSPTINKKSNQIERSVQDLYRWNEIKQTRQELIRRYFDAKQQQSKQTLCFTNDASNKMIQQSRPQNEAVENILLQKGQDAKDRVKNKENELYCQPRVPHITNKAKNLKRDGSVYDRLYSSKQETTQLEKCVSDTKILRVTPDTRPLISPTRKTVSAQLKLDKRCSDPSINLMPLSGWLRKVQQQSQNSQRDILKQQPSSPIQTDGIKHCFFSIVEEQQKLQNNNKKNRSVSNERGGNRVQQHQKINKTQQYAKGEKKKHFQISKLYEYILEQNK